jgi:ADP-ribosylglycohydrolase
MFMSTLLITGAICGLYFLFQIIRNTVQDYLEEAELNRQYMNRAYREAKDATAKKHKIAP